jgi:hypothetical protein
VEDTARAATRPTALTPPAVMRGTAIGMMIGSSAVEDANAETTPPT